MKYLIASARPILEDFLGTLFFYGIYLATGSARVAAIVGLTVGIGQIGLHLYRRQRVPTLLLMGVSLTAILGLMTFFTYDARFLLLKPSIIYVAIGLTMLPRGWVKRYVPAIALDLLPGRWFDWVGWLWAGLILGTAMLNLVLVATMPPIRAAAAFAIFAMASKLVLFAGQYAILRRAAGRAYRARAETRAMDGERHPA